MRRYYYVQDGKEEGLELKFPSRYTILVKTMVKTGGYLINKVILYLIVHIWCHCKVKSKQKCYTEDNKGDL